MGFEINTSDVCIAIAELENRVKMAINLYGDTASMKLEAYAKENAPWQNHSGNARKTIQGGKEWEGDLLKIYLAGNTDYFPYLELCNEKKYAILKPTIDKYSPQIVSGLSNILRG